MLCLQDDTPLQLYMHGVDLYMNSHFDNWIVDISQWRPGPIDEENWRVPDFCHQGEFEEVQRHQLDSSLAMQVARQLPNPHFGTLLLLMHACKFVRMTVATVAETPRCDKVL